MNKDNRSKSTRNFINQSGQVDRSTFNPLVNSITKPSMSKQNQNERVNEMTHKIMNQVNRLYNQSQMRAITKEGLREGGAKLFYDVFSILIRGIDNKIQREQVTLQFILDILRLFNYNGNLNRNIFQPIGAPHTWLHCLSILEFIAEVVAITSAFRGHSKEFLRGKDIEKDENYITMKAVLLNKPQTLRIKLEDQTYQLQKRCTQLNNITLNTELAIKNMHNQQKTLQQLDTQILREKDKDRQFQQEIIQQRHQNNRLDNQTTLIKVKIREGETMQAAMGDEVAALQYKLEHNEVTPDQSVRLEEQIKQGEYQQQLLQQSIQNLVQQFRSNLQVSLREIKEAYFKHELSSQEMSRHTALEMRLQAQPNALQQLCEFPETILSSNEIRNWNIPNEVNRMFSALFLNNTARNAQRAIEQSKRRVTNLKIQLQGLKNTMKNLNDRILQLRYQMGQQVIKKQSLGQNITTKENKAKQLKYQIETIKIKRASVNEQTQKTKACIQRIQRVCDQLQEQIAGIAEDKQTFQQQIVKNVAQTELIIKQSQLKANEQLTNNKNAINQIHERAISSPEFQEEISAESQDYQQAQN